MFGKEEKERQARLQRLLARDRGLPPPDAAPTGQLPPLTGLGDFGKPGTPPAARRPVAKLKQLSALQKKQRRKRWGILAALALVATALVAAATGALGSSLALLGDMVDSIYLSVNTKGVEWPVSTGISQPLRMEALAGGFVELGNEDVAVYAAHGGKIRAFQPGYARPALAVGNTRFCVYNRSGTELRVESRTKNLYTKNFSEGILLAAMSNNGSTAVVTQSNRYAAQVTVYDPLFQERYNWYPTQTDGTPFSLAFASDNHRFAAGCLSAQGGQLCTTVFLMDTHTDTVTASYTATPGSMILELHWLSPTRLLAVFDNYAAIINPNTGAEAARFDYGGSTLKSVAVSGKNTAFLLASRSGSVLNLRDDSLDALAQVLVGQANAVSCAGTAVYVLGDATVRRYQFDGICNWEQTFDSRPLAVLDAAKTLVFTGVQVSPLTAPAGR
ncbi:MAG: DUF5711 family protein [Gemmiger sp.]|nr:DUF5711 family protein [Gemmiger sp.]